MEIDAAVHWAPGEPGVFVIVGPEGPAPAGPGGNSELGLAVPPVGFEPTTVGLKVRCSAVELKGRVHVHGSAEHVGPEQ